MLSGMFARSCGFLGAHFFFRLENVSNDVAAGAYARYFFDDCLWLNYKYDYELQLKALKQGSIGNIAQLIVS